MRAYVKCLLRTHAIEILFCDKFSNSSPACQRECKKIQGSSISNGEGFCFCYSLHSKKRRREGLNSFGLRDACFPFRAGHHFARARSGIPLIRRGFPESLPLLEELAGPDLSLNEMCFRFRGFRLRRPACAAGPRKGQRPLTPRRMHAHSSVSFIVDKIREIRAYL